MSTAALSGRRILVVEDDYMIATEIQGELERAGATVIGPVSSVRKALRLTETETVDAAVLDVNLGEEASFPIAEALVAKSVPFLFCTGYSSGDVPEEWQHAMIVMKPLKITALKQLLANVSPS